MPFLLNSRAQGVSGKNEQSTQTPWRGAPEARGPMQLHRLHRLKAGPVPTTPLWLQMTLYQTLPFAISASPESP